MAALELILAVFGVLFVLLVVFLVLGEQPPTVPPPAEDRAAPYREALHASVRLRHSAQDLEQQIWAEAARHQGSTNEQ